MTWITKGDEPELLKTIANGEPGFMVLPQGEDDDGMIFTSLEALQGWAEKLSELVKQADGAQSYDDWLEMQG